MRLDFFEYKWSEPGEQNTIYHNCVVLKPFDKYQRGQKVDAIALFVELYIYEGEEMVVRRSKLLSSWR